MRINKCVGIAVFVLLLLLSFVAVQGSAPEIEKEVAYEFGQVTAQEAFAALRLAERDVAELKERGYSANYVTDVYLEAKRAYEGKSKEDLELEIEQLNQSGQSYQITRLEKLYEDSIKEYGKYGFDYTLVLEKAGQIKQRKEKTYLLDENLRLLENTLNSQKELYRYDWSSAEQILNDAKIAFREERFDDVEEFIPKINKEIEDIRFESSSLKILSEASRKNVKDYVITNWKWLSVVVVVLIVVLILFYNQMMIFGLRRKLRNLKIEKETIVDLEKKNQKDYFEKKTISQATYKNYANKYKERILQVDEEIPVVEDQLRERQKFRIGYLTKRK